MENNDSTAATIRTAPVPTVVLTDSTREAQSDPYCLPVDFAPADSTGPDTSYFDSIAANPYYALADSADFADTVLVAAVEPPAPRGVDEGISGRPVSHDPGTNSLLSGMLVLIMVVISVNSASLRRILKNYSNGLWSIRVRHNVFDDNPSSSWAMATMLALQFVATGGIALYYGCISSFPGPGVAGVFACMGILGAYYIFQECAYRLLGYAFATPARSRQLLEGFAASQAFAGIVLIIPVFLLMLFPPWRQWLVALCLSVYVASRLIFISKGFRIFYSNIGSLLYFILYLCSLEIIPSVAVYSFVVMMMGYTN